MELKEFFILIKFIITKFEKLKVSYCWSTTAVHQYSRLFHCSFPLYLNISGWGVGGGAHDSLQDYSPPRVVYATALLSGSLPPPLGLSKFTLVTLTIEY